MSAGRAPFRVHWIRALADDGRGAFGDAGSGWSGLLLDVASGPYLPVEAASPAVDGVGSRVYAGLSSGVLLGLSLQGRSTFKYQAESAIESGVVLDARNRELFFGTEDGYVHAVDADTAQRKWRIGVSGPVRQLPLLLEDAVYVVSSDAHVAALSRANGQVLWTHRRDAASQSFSISGHAGLARAGTRVVTGFEDGKVVALDLGDGQVAWEFDSSLDVEPGEQGLPSFVDVDSTPLVVAGQALIASYSGGLYGLDAESGEVLWRKPEWTGITHMAGSGEHVLLASAEWGLMCMNPKEQRTVWRRRAHRGSPTPPRIHRGLVLTGESRGALLALSLRDGRELARVESGNGFSAAPAAYGDMVFALSNGGTVYALALN